MYSSGYTGLGVDVNAYPQNVYTQGTVLPTLNQTLTSVGTFQNPTGYLQAGIQGVGVGGYSAQPMMQQPMMQQPMMQQPMMNQPMQQPMVDAPTPQDPNAYNPFDDAQREIDPNQIPKQWWQQ